MPKRTGTDFRQPKVGVLILNYNGLKWLDACLSSVSHSTYPNYDVYLVDNASTDGSVEFVQKAFPNVRIIAYKTNLGFAEAYNRAISQVDYKYVVLLNNDTRVANEDWLQHLVSVAQRDRAIAAVACKIVSMQNYRILGSVGSMGIPYWRGFVDIGKDERDDGQYSEGFEPFAFCGGAALISRTAFLDVGGFDESFFLYMEDSDISWRLRLNGLAIGFAPEALVAHFFSATLGGAALSPVKLYYCHRNYFRSIVKNCGSSLKRALANYVLFTLFLLFGFTILEPRKARAVFKGLAWNVSHLRDTYAQRKRVQSMRRVDDFELLQKMYAPLRRYQPGDHARLRHIVDSVFFQ